MNLVNFTKEERIASAQSLLKNLAETITTALEVSTKAEPVSLIKKPDFTDLVDKLERVQFDRTSVISNYKEGQNVCEITKGHVLKIDEDAAHRIFIKCHCCDAEWTTSADL